MTGTRSFAFALAVIALAAIAIAGVVAPVVGAAAVPTSSVGPTAHAHGAVDVPPAGAGSNGTGTGTNDTDPRFEAVYPNPVADGDVGEFVVIRAPTETNLGAYRLTDGEDVLALPDRTVNGTVALTGAQSLVRNLTDYRVLAFDQQLALANGGERLTLERDGEPVATARYRDAPEGRLGRFDDRGTVAWRPLGRTDRPVVTARGGTVRAFTLPDAPGVPIDLLRDADQQVLLAGYTFTSARATDALVRAADRGVDVRVLLEGSPVDGITTRQARLLDRLVAAGVEVRLLGGPRSRYAYHHAKYAVVDGRAIVLTENWKPAGTGGASSRGWGVVVSRRPVVTGLADTFRADAAGVDAIPWTEFRRGRSFTDGGVANGTYPSQFDPARLPVNRTRLLVTPDNAGAAVTAILENATDSIDVVQMSIDGPDQRFLRATLRAARRGVEIRVLLSGAWYVREENRRLVESLRERAERESLPLEAKVADSGAFEKIHAKGVVVDGDQVLLGSLNWNGESIRSNREVVLSLEGARVGDYYQRVFEADWGDEDESVPLPVELIAALAGAVVLAGLVAWRIDFDAGVGVAVDP